MGIQRKIYIVDTDTADLERSARVLYQHGFFVSTFQNGSDLIHRLNDESLCCLVYDTSLADHGATSLLDMLHDNKRHVPVVFMARNPSVSLIVQVMKLGAIDFLQKPFNDQALVGAVMEAVTKYDSALLNYDAHQRIQMRFRNLTAREREILKFVATGMLNKQVALELGISEKTVKAHRGRVMRKLEVQSLAELVRFWDQLRPN